MKMHRLYLIFTFLNAVISNGTEGACETPSQTGDSNNTKQTSLWPCDVALQQRHPERHDGQSRRPRRSARHLRKGTYIFLFCFCSPSMVFVSTTIGFSTLPTFGFFGYSAPSPSPSSNSLSPSVIFRFIDYVIF